jgi:hypothetical protein
MQPIWMTIEPCPSEVRLLLTEPGAGPALKARLPLPAPRSRAPLLLLEAFSAWYGRPLHAVLDADAEEVQRHPERWVHLAGDLPLVDVSIEWARAPSEAERKRRGRYLDEMGDTRSARRLLGLSATGMP